MFHSETALWLAKHKVPKHYDDRLLAVKRLQVAYVSTYFFMTSLNALFHFLDEDFQNAKTNFNLKMLR